MVWLLLSTPPTSRWRLSHEEVSMPPNWSSATCPICLRELGVEGVPERHAPEGTDEPVVGLTCGDYFHEPCINQWSSEKGNHDVPCPVRQTPISHPIPERWP